MENKEMRMREWINTGISVLVLATMILGVYYGTSQLEDININLKEIKSEKVSATEFEVLTPNGSSSRTYIYHNGSDMVIGSKN